MQGNGQEKSPIKGRISQYLEIKGITKYAFYKDSGITRGILDQDTGISEDNIARFLAYAKDISPLWLISGEGEILQTKSIENVPEQKGDRLGDKRKVQKTSSNMDSDRFDPRDIKLIAALEKTIASHEKVIARDEEVIAGLRQRISDLEKGFGSRGLGSARSPIGEVKPGQRTSL